MAKPLAISPDGKWVVIGEHYNNNPRANNTFFINTDSHQKIDLTHFKEFYNNILNEGLVVGRVNKDLTIYSLNKQDSIVKKNIVNFDTFIDKTIVYTLDTNNVFSVYELKKDLTKTKTLIQKTNIKKYYLNNSKNHIILVNNDNELLHIDSKSMKIKKLLNISGEFSYIKWNFTNDAFAIKTNNVVTLINLTNYDIKSTIINEENEIDNFKISFFRNNDMFITYETKTNEKIPQRELVDIWKGNSRLILPSNFQVKYTKKYKAHVFSYLKNNLTELNRHIDNEYINLGIPNLLLIYNQFEFEDFSQITANSEYFLFDITKKNKSTSLTKAWNNSFQTSLDSHYIFYPNKNNKTLELINTKTLKKEHITSVPYNTKLWTIDNQTILYYNKNKLLTYNYVTKKFKTIVELDNSLDITSIIHNKPNEHKLDLKKSFYFTAIHNLDKDNNYIFYFENNKTKTAFQTKDLIDLGRLSKKLTTSNSDNLVFSIENHNMPPKLIRLNKQKADTLFSSNINEKLFNWRKSITVQYKDKDNVILNGFLQYPKNFNPNKKYPMIVYVYDLSFSVSPKNFMIPKKISAKNGFNNALFTENGYFVLFAQTRVTDKGPGISAVNNIKNLLNNTLKKEPSIDHNNLGIYGHSFGGYKSSFISVSTNLFKASVSNAGIHDIVGGLMYRYSNSRKKPDWVRAESVQLNMKEKYSQNPQKYIDNSPIHQAHKSQTAMLLITGLQDENAHWLNTRRMFIALKREQKPVIALFYKNIGHNATTENPIEKYDIATKVLQWFDYHLKDSTKTPWISNGLDYNKYSLTPL
ncbi:alpha/beta hydrolase family protein [Myroides pelagicus]|nr:prolyl oligopeptidase family serine peptidase [Myroides pelagicus]